MFASTVTAPEPGEDDRLSQERRVLAAAEKLRAGAEEAEAVLAEVLGGDVACVPYVMPGFALAKLAAETFEGRAGLKGLVGPASPR